MNYTWKAVLRLGDSKGSMYQQHIRIRENVEYNFNKVVIFCQVTW